jgi:hypothetical protein
MERTELFDRAAQRVEDVERFCQREKRSVRTPTQTSAQRAECASILGH